MDYRNKRVLVCGVGKSGISSALLLKTLGASITLQDIKTADQCKDALAHLDGTDFQYYLGKNPDRDFLSRQDMVVVSPGIALDVPFLVLAKEMGIPIIGEIELGYVVSKAPIVAITGTNGKTTTTALVGEIMAGSVAQAAVVGNIGVPFTDKAPHVKEDGVIVSEVSSFQLETIHRFRPKVSAVLNITPDHTDRHKTMENYILAKERIFMNQQESDYLVLNYDDPVCRKMAGKTKSRVVWFSRSEKLDHGAFISGQKVVWTWNGEVKEVIQVANIPMPGTHNLENILAATAICAVFGISLQTVGEKIAAFKGVPHRLEYVASIGDVAFYNDSKGTNPDAAIKALEAMTKPVVLIGGGYDKNADFTKWVGLFPGKVKHVILLGQVADKIEMVCRRYNFNAVTKVNGLEEAVRTGFQKAAPGDVVLLSPACASWGMFENFEQRGDMFKAYVKGLQK